MQRTMRLTISKIRPLPYCLANFAALSVHLAREPLQGRHCGSS